MPVLNLCTSQRTYVGLKEAAHQMDNGMRKGYLLSPLLYIIYDEAIMKAAV